MTKLLGLLGGPMLPIGLLGLLLLSLTVNGCQRQQVLRYKETSTQLTTTNRALIDNSKQQERVVDRQTNELTAWKATADKSALDMKNALVAANLAQRSLTTYQLQLKQIEDKDRGNPTCEAFLAMDLANACPNAARSMQLRAAGDLPGQGGRDSDAGRPAH